jgi:hypothetical protein
MTAVCNKKEETSGLYVQARNKRGCIKPISIRCLFAKNQLAKMPLRKKKKAKMPKNKF